MKWTRSLILALLFVVPTLTVGCGSSRIAKLDKAVKAACDFYQAERPRIVVYRAWALEHWDETLSLADGSTVPLIPAKTKELLVEFDGYLPFLDKTGVLICDLAAGSPVADGKIEWDRALVVLIRLAELAVESGAGGAP